MVYILVILITSSMSFSSYYDIGDTVLYEHQTLPLDVCYGDYPSDFISLLDLKGKIIIFGMTASW